MKSYQLTVTVPASDSSVALVLACAVTLDSICPHKMLSSFVEAVNWTLGVWGGLNVLELVERRR